MVGNPSTVSQTTHCCICSKIISPKAPVVEQRPTADNGSAEQWFYCPRCWVELKKLRRIDLETRSLVRVLDLSAEAEKRTSPRFHPLLLRLKKARFSIGSPSH